MAKEKKFYFPREEGSSSNEGGSKKTKDRPIKRCPGKKIGG